MVRLKAPAAHRMALKLHEMKAPAADGRALRFYARCLGMIHLGVCI